MSKSIQEVTKIMSKTTPNGEVNFEPMDADVADKLNGTEITDSKGNRVKIKDTGKTVTENVSDTLGNNDMLNLGKDLNNVLQDALREHGDTIAFTKAKYHRYRSTDFKDSYIVVYVNYEQNTDNPGNPSEDRFIFIPRNSKIYLQGQEICPIIKQSGTLTINRDIAKDSILKFLDDNADVDTNSAEQPKNIFSELDEELLLGFRKAVDNYRQNTRDKESIKELLRQARNFEGDNIVSKLQNAIKLYKDSADSDCVEEPVVSSCDSRTCPTDIVMDSSLLIRILEFVREEMKGDDVVLHILAENLEKVCKEKGHACMEDYDTIIGTACIAKAIEECPPEESNLEESSFDERYDVSIRAAHLDNIGNQDLKNAVMQAISDLFDVPESLDDSVEDYIRHTIPELTVDQFKQAVNSVLEHPNDFRK